MKQRLELVGWLLFLASAGFFLARSWRDGDVLGFGASITFLGGVGAFLVALRR